MRKEGAFRCPMKGNDGKDMNLSACYIAKNEEKNLPRSIASLQDAVDELIVVDTGSKDRTREIAASLGARVYAFSWQDDFSAARNAAIEKAGGDWILFLDADEFFPPDMNLRTELAVLLDRMPKQGVALLQLYDLDSSLRQDRADRIWAPRLFQNCPEMRYRGRIHEEITAAGGERKLVYAHPELYLLHTGYAGVLGREKAERNLRLIQEAVKQDGWEPRYDYYLMDCCYGMKRYEEAFRHAVAFLNSEITLVGDVSHVYHMILESLRGMGCPAADMLPWAQKACAVYPDLPEYYAEQGMIYCGMGELPKARQLLIDALLHYEQHTAAPHHATYFSREVAARVAARLGEIAMQYHDVDEAAVWFRQAMDYCDTCEAVTSKVRRFLKQVEEERRGASE